MKYDYIIVGSGLFGSTFAYEMNKRYKKCLVIEKRNHVGGNIYCEDIHGIQVHKYGAHIFHTSNKDIWDYMNQFTEFNNYVNSPIANYHGELYNLPFNMNTFTKLWNDVKTPDDAKKKIESERNEVKDILPSNLEEQAISLVGRTIYEKLIQGYTEKQWGKKCNELPSFIIKRLPVRYTFNNNYFNDRYQGIPVNGYNPIIEYMLKGIDVQLNMDYLKDKAKYEMMGKTIIYTGMIDEYYDYVYGYLEYRSLKFETQYLENIDNYQGVAVMNYTDAETPYTRIIEHKHFLFQEGKGTVITKEYPMTWHPGMESFYPVNNDKNNELYQKYLELSKKEKKVIFGGRLGRYQYQDMDKIVQASLELVQELSNE